MFCIMLAFLFTFTKNNVDYQNCKYLIEKCDSLMFLEKTICFLSVDKNQQKKQTKKCVTSVIFVTVTLQ